MFPLNRFSFWMDFFSVIDTSSCGCVEHFVATFVNSRWPQPSTTESSCFSRVQWLPNCSLCRRTLNWSQSPFSLSSRTHSRPLESREDNMRPPLLHLLSIKRKMKKVLEEFVSSLRSFKVTPPTERPMGGPPTPLWFFGDIRSVEKQLKKKCKKSAKNLWKKCEKPIYTWTRATSTKILC